MTHKIVRTQTLAMTAGKHNLADPTLHQRTQKDSFIFLKWTLHGVQPITQNGTIGAHDTSQVHVYVRM